MKTKRIITFILSLCMILSSAVILPAATCSAATRQQSYYNVWSDGDVDSLYLSTDRKANIGYPFMLMGESYTTEPFTVYVECEGIVPPTEDKLGLAFGCEILETKYVSANLISITMQADDGFIIQWNM